MIRRRLYAFPVCLGVRQETKETRFDVGTDHDATETHALLAKHGSAARRVSVKKIKITRAFTTDPYVVFAIGVRTKRPNRNYVVIVLPPRRATIHGTYLSSLRVAETSFGDRKTTGRNNSDFRFEQQQLEVPAR